MFNGNFSYCLKISYPSSDIWWLRLKLDALKTKGNDRSWTATFWLYQALWTSSFTSSLSLDTCWLFSFNSITFLFLNSCEFGLIVTWVTHLFLKLLVGKNCCQNTFTPRSFSFFFLISYYLTSFLSNTIIHFQIHAIHPAHCRIRSVSDSRWNRGRSQEVARTHPRRYL